MADSYTTKKITDLTANTSVADTDLFVVGNAGTSTMRKLSFSYLAAAVRDKLTSLTFSGFTTTAKTIPGAINELNSKRPSSLHTVSLGPYKDTAANTWNYTGFTIVVPTGHIYLCSVSTGYISGQPTGIGVNESTSLTGSSPSYAHEVTNSATYGSPAFLLYAGTWYVFSRRAAVATSNNNYYARYIDIGL